MLRFVDKKMGKVTKMMSRRFTKAETILFNKILSDPDNQRESSNEEVFANIKHVFGEALKNDHFVAKNERENFTKKNGDVVLYEQLDISIPKLRAKLKILKTDWRKITDRAKTGSGLSPQVELEWYTIWNTVFFGN